MTNLLITLACIVGNEEAHIERFIRSFSAVADHMVFCMAIGNQQPDSTREIIVQTCTGLSKPFSIIDYKNHTDFPHIDHFGNARQRSWEYASGAGCKYIMWADCDDSIKDEGATNAIREAAATGEYDVYMMPYHVRGTSQIVMRERMAKNDGCSQWAYPIHEQLQFTRDVTYKILREAIIVHQPITEKKTSHPRNVAILEKETQDTGRNLFYLQQEYFNTGNVEKFRKYAHAALACQLDGLEKYETLLNLAQSETGPDAKTYAARAFEVMPDRREALALLVNYAIIDRNYEKANQLAFIMMGIEKPKMTYWSLNHDWYSWKGFYLYTQALRLNGKEDESRNLEETEFQKHGASISLLHATRGRVAQALACRDLWLSRASNPMCIEHIFAFDGDDAQSRVTLKGFRHVVNEYEGCVPAWNLAAKASKGNILIQLSDDWIPPVGWDTMILDRLPCDGESVLAISDGHRKDNLLCMAILTRKYYEANGLFHSDFTSVYSDNYFTHVAYQKNAVIEARDLVFEHRHPVFDPAIPMDETYSKSNSLERYRQGEETFRRLVQS